MENIKKWQTCHFATTLIVSPVETPDGRHETEGRTTQKDCSVTAMGIRPTMIMIITTIIIVTISNNGLLAQFQYLNIIPADISTRS
jgi:hypothetical protein